MNKKTISNVKYPTGNWVPSLKDILEIAKNNFPDTPMDKIIIKPDEKEMKVFVVNCGPETEKEYRERVNEVESEISKIMEQIKIFNQTKKNLEISLQKMKENRKE